MAFTIYRLALDDPEAWHEQLGDAVTNQGGAPVPAVRTALRHEAVLPTFTPNATDTVAQRLAVRRKLRSLANNTPFKLSGYYVAYDEDTEQNGWYLPDQGQLVDGDGASGLASGYWKVENFVWFKAGAPRTHRRAFWVYLKDLRGGLYARDVLRRQFSTDFSALSTLALSYFPPGATDLMITANAQRVVPNVQPAGRDGGATQVASGLLDLERVSFEQSDANRNLGQVIAYDRRGTNGYGYTVQTLTSPAPSAYWRFNDTSGTTAADSSSGGHNGTYAGGFTLGQPGATLDASTSVLLDNSTGRIATTYQPFAQNSTLTLAGWAYRKANSDADTLVGSDGTNVVLLRCQSGSNDVAFFPNTSLASVTWAGALPGTGVWFHWALVYNDSTKAASLYVNGSLVSTQTVGNGFGASPGNIELGARAGTVDPFNGQLQDVAVWAGTALSAAQITTLYQGGLQTADPQTYFGWEEFYGPDYPYTSGDTPVLDNGRVRVRYDSANTPGWRIDWWTGSAYVEQGKVVIQRRSNAGTLYCDTLLSTELVEYTETRAVLQAILSVSTDTSSREMVYITLEQGAAGPRFEVYPAPNSDGTATNAVVVYKIQAADTDDSVMVFGGISGGLSPTGSAVNTATAQGTGHNGQLPNGFLNSNFSTYENQVAVLRSGAASALSTGVQFAVIQAANAQVWAGNDTNGYGMARNTINTASQNTSGYVSTQISYVSQQAQQVMEAEAMTLGAGSSLVTDTAASPSGGSNNAVQTSRSTDANAHVTQATWPNGQFGKYRVFVRARLVGGATAANLYAKTGGTTGSTVALTSATYVWLDLGDILANNTTLELHAWINMATPTGQINIDRIEAVLMEDRTAAANIWAGCRDAGQSSLYDNRSTPTLVSRTV